MFTAVGREGYRSTLDSQACSDLEIINAEEPAEDRNNRRDKGKGNGQLGERLTESYNDQLQALSRAFM